MWRFAKTAVVAGRYGGSMIRTAILAVSDQGTADERLTVGVTALRGLLQTGEFVEVEFLVVPDEQAVIRSKLRLLSDTETSDVILTLGGAGLGPKERAPEATREVLERDLPGLADLVRRAYLEQSVKGALYRGVCGLRRRTLILNLPGDAAAAEAGLRAVLPALPQVVATLVGLPRVG
jgi:molybdopterin adenylyltransferase